MEIIKSGKVAVVFGASGLVGRHCLEQLLQHEAYEEVRAVGRREFSLKHSKLKTFVVDFDRLDTYNELFEGVHDVFLCLGTTRASAGSDEAFYKVDFTYSFNAAKLAAMQGANQLLLVSSVGANEDSRLLYFRTKGELEKAVSRLPYWAIHIFHPSTLLGERPENRWGESFAKVIGKGLNWITGNRLSRMRPIEAEVVAKAMIDAAQRLHPGLHYHENEALHRLADEADRQLAKRK